MYTVFFTQNRKSESIQFAEQSTAVAYARFISKRVSISGVEIEGPDGLTVKF